MKRILIGSFLEVHSNGDMAVLTSMVKSLRETMPEASLTLLISAPEVTQARYGDFLRTNKVEVVRSPWFAEHGSRLVTLVYSGLRALQFALLRRGFLRRYDLYLELGTDTHTDYYGTIPFYACLFPLLLCIASKRPFAVCAQTVGPFNSRLSKRVARFVFSRARLITLRDKISQDYLNALGITGTHLVADLAFLLQPVPDGRVVEILSGEGVAASGRPLVGVAVSQRIHTYAFGSTENERERKAKYVELMAALADRLVEVLGATVLLVSHDNTPRMSDRLVSEDIHRQAKAKDRVVVLDGGYRTEEIKGVIGGCDLFVGCRMHAVIAAVSMHVPTIAVSYGHKFQGVLAGLLNPEQDIVDIAQYGPEELLDELTLRIRRKWEAREEVARALGDKMSGVRSRALLNATLVADLIGTKADSGTAAKS